MTGEIRLPQHEHDPIYGDLVTLEHDGTFSINRFDGITIITKEQARAIAAVLIAWADGEFGNAHQGPAR